MNVRLKTLVNFRLSGDCQTHSRTNVTVDNHQLMIDEPESRGGTDMGASPVATILASLVGCTNRITNKVAERNGITIDNLEVIIDAKFDRRCLEEDLPVPIPSIDVYIEMTTLASDDDIAVIKRELPIYCPVSKIFRQAGTEVNDIWTIVRPS